MRWIFVLAFALGGGLALLIRRRDVKREGHIRYAFGSRAVTIAAVVLAFGAILFAVLVILPSVK
jgi:hypothetical protein